MTFLFFVSSPALQKRQENFDAILTTISTRIGHFFFILFYFYVFLPNESQTKTENEKKKLNQITLK